MKQNVVLKLAYDGSSFFGWQKTTSGNSIEGTLQTCLERILQESISLQAAVGLQNLHTTLSDQDRKIFLRFSGHGMP